MIDLNMQRKPEKEEQDPPMGVMILALLPFAALFAVIVTVSFLNGIY